MPKNTKAADPTVRPEDMVGFLLRLLQHTLRQNMDDGFRKEGVEHDVLNETGDEIVFLEIELKA